MRSTLTSKGQVTIPAEARKKLGLHAGSRIDFILTKDDRLELVPVSGSVTHLKGMVPRPRKTLSVAEMNAVIAQRSGK